MSMMVSPWLLIVFASVPKAVEAIRGFRGKTLPVEMMPLWRGPDEYLFGLFLVVGSSAAKCQKISGVLVNILCVRESLGM